MYYNLFLKYISWNDWHTICSDTDSTYIALSTPSIEKAIKPSMMQDFLYVIKEQCTNEQVMEIDNKYRWFCRKRCEKCYITDSRQPAIFHIEWSSSRIGDECVGLASKLYILQNISVEKKLEQSFNKKVYCINAVRKARQIRKVFV